MDPSAPIRGEFVYAAWEVDLRVRGPFVLPSGTRRRFVSALSETAEVLRRSGAVGGVRGLESTFVVPAAGRPRFDVALLVDGPGDVVPAVLGAVRARGLPEPGFVRAARNRIRFGDTDSLSGPILLNHFASPAPAHEVAEAWAGISTWYGSALGVTNSTLLEFADPEPFVVMNYASIPGPVPRFLLDQLLRPSFYRTVTPQLKAAQARALPIFARRIP